MFNPLIYPVIIRIRYFRVAFIQLLLRKTIAEADQLEMNVFGLKQVRVVATAEQGENRVSPRREGAVKQGNEAWTDNGNLCKRSEEKYQETVL